MARVKPKPTPKPRKAARKPRSRLRRILRALILWPLRIAVAVALFCVLWVALYRFVPPPGGIYMAQQAWERGGIERDWRSIEEISPRLARSVMAAEDARFCDHYGFDFDAIRAAIKLNEQGKRTYGASTITQQTAKNVFLWHKRSWVRKGLEAGFTVLIELLWPKQRILEVYLNTAEFAPGVFGASPAPSWQPRTPAFATTTASTSKPSAPQSN